MQLELPQKPTLLISKEVLSIITYLHSKEKVEWSGSLFYSIVSGSIEDPDNLILKAEYIHLMDIGSAAYTEFDISGELFLSVFDNEPTLEDRLMNGEVKIGFVHTHHTMATNPSGTDTQELLDNCKFFPYYLSLIVNYSGNYNARIAIKGKYKKKSIDNNFSFNNVGGTSACMNFKDDDLDSDAIAIMNCNVVFEIPESIEKQYNTIKSKVKTPAAPAYNMYNRSYVGYQNTAAGSQKSTTPTSSYQEFLAAWIMDDKKTTNNLFQSIVQLESTYAKSNKKQCKSILNNRKNSFSGMAQSFMGKKPSYVELEELADECIRWLQSYTVTYEIASELVGILETFITPSVYGNGGNTGNLWDNNRDWYY